MKYIKDLICIVTLLSLFAAVGCSVKQEAPAAQGSEDSTAQTMQVEVASTVTGEVESIVGNEVTLLLGEVKQSEKPEGMEMPEGMEAPEGMEKPEGMERPEGGNFPEDGMTEGMEMPQGGSFPGGGQMPQSGRGGQSVEIELNGETGVYILPVGMKFGSGDYSSVTSGMVLQLKLDADGNVVAGSILSR